MGWMDKNKKKVNRINNLKRYLLCNAWEKNHMNYNIHTFAEESLFHQINLDIKHIII